MKRRSFLAMIGAVATAPVLPASAGTLTPNLRALGAAHAHKFPMVSVLGLSRRLNIPTEQAVEVLNYLRQTGLVGSSGVQASGLTSSASKVFRPIPHRIAGVGSMKRVNVAKLKEQFAERAAPKTPTRDWIAHLQGICQRNGYVLQPRAMSGEAA